MFFFQIELLSAEAYMSMIKSNFCVDQKQLSRCSLNLINTHKESFQNGILTNNNSTSHYNNYSNNMTNKFPPAIPPPPQSSQTNSLNTNTNSHIPNDLVSKIKKNLEQKALMINSSKQQQNV